MLALKLGLWTGNVAALGGPSYSAEATALFARRAAAGITDSGATKAAIDTLIVNGKTNGWWTKITNAGVNGGLFALADDASAGGLMDWTQDRSATNNGTTFSALGGFTDSSVAASNQYIDLGFAPTASQLNDVTIGVSCNSQGVAGAASYPHIGTATASRLTIYAAANAINDVYKVNDGAAATVASTGRAAHRTAVRSGSTAKLLYRDGSNVSSLATASSTLSTGNFALFMDNGGYALRGDRLGLAYVGMAMTAGEISALHSAWVAYKAARGIA